MYIRNDTYFRPIRLRGVLRIVEYWIQWNAMTYILCLHCYAWMYHVMSAIRNGNVLGFLSIPEYFLNINFFSVLEYYSNIIFLGIPEYFLNIDFFRYSSNTQEYWPNTRVILQIFSIPFHSTPKFHEYSIPFEYQISVLMPNTDI